MVLANLVNFGSISISMLGLGIFQLKPLNAQDMQKFSKNSENVNLDHILVVVMVTLFFILHHV